MPGVIIDFRTFEQIGADITEYIVGYPSGEVIDISIDDFEKLRKARVLRYDKDKKFFFFLDVNYNSIKSIIKKSKPTEYTQGDRRLYIENWLTFLDIRNYEIKEDFSVDVTGNVDISKMNISKIPVKFRSVTGDFICASNRLCNLTNSPDKIGGIFDCSSNDIYTLLSGPKFVAGGYYCMDNKLVDLEGFPIYCQVVFDASRNLLRTLDGCPDKVTVNYFNVSYNNLKSLKNGPKLTNDFDCNHNEIETLLNGIKDVKGTFNCEHNRLYNITGAPTCYKILFREGNKITEIDYD
jgi:hypothetical protein